MIDLKAIKERCEEANRYDNRGIAHSILTDDLPALVDWVERAKGFVELVVDLHDEDTIELTDEQLQRIKGLLKEVEG